MTVGLDRKAELRAGPARDARTLVAEAEKRSRLLTVEYVDAALDAGWKWDRIGARLSVSGTGIRRYYARNRRKTHGGDI